MTNRPRNHAADAQAGVDGFPRLQMFFLVVLTGAVGMAASYVLLRAGVESMFAVVQHYRMPDAGR